MLDGVTVIDLPRCRVESGEHPAAVVPSFVAGPENRLAVVALKQLLAAEELSNGSGWFHPLVLTGPSGSGKTQLAKAITRHWSAQLGETDVAYFTAIDFARQLHSARSEGQIELFRQYVAALKLLVIEDFQHLPQRSFLQREFRDTLDLLREVGSVVVITASEICCEDSGLRDRLQSGLTVRLSLPGLEARREILSQAAHIRDMRLTSDQLVELSHRVDGPAPRLCQALAELEMQQQLGTSVTAACHPQLKIKQIVAVVARYFKLTQAALQSSARRKSLVHARGMIVYLARMLTNLSYAEIGRGLGGRDHSTVMHAHRCTLKLAATDSTTQRDLEELRRILTAH